MTPTERGRQQNVSLDERAVSQLAYLQKLYVLTHGDTPPVSQIMRRAIGLLTDRMSALVLEGRKASSKTIAEPANEDEKRALSEHHRLVNFARVYAMTDQRGRLLSFGEATSEAGGNAALMIPVSTPARTVVTEINRRCKHAATTAAKLADVVRKYDERNAKRA